MSISRELSGTPPVDGHWPNTAENRPASRPDYGVGQRSFHDEDVIYGFEVGKGLVDQVRGDYGSDDEFAEAVDQLAVRYSGYKGAQSGRDAHRTDHAQTLGKGWAADYGSRLVDSNPPAFSFSSKSMVGHNTDYSLGMPPGAAARRFQKAERELGNDPVDPGSGEYRERRVDIFVPGVGLDLSIARTYSNRYNFHGPLGHGWNHNFNQRIVPQTAPCGLDVEVLHWVTGEGTTLEFQPREDGYQSNPPSPWKLKRNEEGYTVVAHDGIRYRFDAGGFLESIVDLDGNAIAVEWEEPEGDLLTRVLAVTDTQGRRFSFAYDSRGYLESISAAAFDIYVEYVVDEFEDLVRVVAPTGVSEEYEYDQSAYEEVDYIPDVALESMCESMCGLTEDVCGGRQCTDQDLIASWREDCLDECQPTHEACDETCSGSCETICADENDECFHLCGEFCDSCDANVGSECSALLNSGGGNGICLPACEEGCDSECAGENCVPRVAECFEFLQVSVGPGGTGAYAASSGQCGFWESIGSILDTLWDTVKLIFAALWEGIEWAACKFLSWFGYNCKRDRMTFDVVDELADEWCTQFCHKCCMYGEGCPDNAQQNNHDCWADCERAFVERCVAKLENGCRRSCQTRCPDACVASCEPICQYQCVSNCNDDYDCNLTCSTMGFAAACGETCTSDCREAHKNPEGYSYGRPGDLQHNLLRVFDGNGELFLENTYGTDVRSPDFDRVITQRFGHDTSSYAFYDLTHPDTEIAAADGPFVETAPGQVGICAHPKVCVVDTPPPMAETPPELLAGPLGPLPQPYELPEIPERPTFAVGPPWVDFADRFENAMQSIELDVFKGVYLNPNLPEGISLADQPPGVGGPPLVLGGETVLPPSYGDIVPPFRGLPIVPMSATGAPPPALVGAPATRSLFSGELGLLFDAMYDGIDQLRQAMAEVSDEGGGDQSVYNDWLADRAEFAAQLNARWHRIAYALREDNIELRSISVPQVDESESACSRFEESDGYFEAPLFSEEGSWQVFSRAVVVRTGDGHVWTYYTDDAGRILRQVNHDTGWKVDRNFDELGRVSGELHGHGNRTCLEYGDDWNLRSRTRLPNGVDWTEQDEIKETFRWGPYGRLRNVYFDSPLEPLISYHWDDKGRLETVEDSQGIVASYQYDDRGRLTREERRNGLVVEVDAFDEASGFWEQVSVQGTPGESYVATAQWDQLGFPEMRQSGLGRQDWYDFGPNGVLQNHSFRLDDGQALVSIGYGYDSAGDLSRTEYATDGVVERIVDYTSNLVGLLEHVETTADGRTFHECYRYDATHDLVELVRADGSRVRILRDARGNTIGIERGFWASSDESWDDECLEPGMSALEIVTSVAYAPSGLALQVQRGAQNPVELRYDGYGRLAESSIEGVVRHRQGLDARGRLAWQATLLPETGPLVAGWVSDPNSSDVVRFEEFSYDEHDRLTNRKHRNWHVRDLRSGARTTLQDTVEESLLYDDATGLVRHVDAIGVHTDYRYDRLGKLLSVEFADGSAIRREYGNPRQFNETTSFANDPGLVTRQVTLTAWGEPLTVSDSQGRPLALLEYDPWGRLAAHSTGAESRRWERDSFGRVAEQWLVDVEGNGELEGLVTHDGLSRPELVEDANGNVTQYAYGYEGARQTTTVTHPDGNQDTMWFESGSERVEQVRTRGGDDVFVDYDDYGSVASLRFTSRNAGAEWSGWSEVSFDRNPYGLWRIASTNRPGTTSDDIVIERTVDSRGLVSQEYSSEYPDRAVSYGYDPRGLVETIDSDLGLLTYRRDDLGRATNIFQGDRELVRYGFDGLGPAVTRDLASGIHESWTYSSEGVPASWSVTSSGEPAYAERYGWLPEHLLGRIDRSIGDERRSSVYGRDRFGRLTTEAHDLAGLAEMDSEWLTTSALSEAFALAEDWEHRTYDVLGNWTAIERSEGGPLGPSLAAGNSYRAFVDDLGLDVSGNATSWNGQVLRFDGLNRLVGAESAAGDIDLAYDGLGRLTRWHDGTATNRILHGVGGPLVRDRAGWGEVLMVPGESGLEALVDGDNVAYLHTQWTHRVVAATDGTGQIVQQTRFGAFGPLTSEGHEELPVALEGFGQWLGQGTIGIPELNLYHMGARWYSPDMGRFISPDPAGFIDGFNQYAFVGNLPFTYHDPQGLWRKSLFSGLRSTVDFGGGVAHGIVGASGNEYAELTGGSFEPYNEIAFESGRVLGSSVGLVGDAAMIAGGITIAGGSASGGAVLAVPSLGTAAFAGAAGVATGAGIAGAGAGLAALHQRSRAEGLQNLQRLLGQSRASGRGGGNTVRADKPPASAQVPRWRQYEARHGGRQTTMRTSFRGEERVVRLDKPPRNSEIVDFQDYDWANPAYERPFIRQRVIHDFQEQIRLYQTIRPHVHFQFSQSPPQWVVDALLEVGGTYSVLP